MTNNEEPNEPKKHWMPEWIAGPDGGNPAMIVLGVICLGIILVPVAAVVLDVNQSSGGQLAWSGLIGFGIAGVVLFMAAVVYFLYRIADKD